MRILFVIPHCVNPNGDPSYASSRAVQPRMVALKTCITALYQLFGTVQYASVYDPATQSPIANLANRSQTHTIEVVVCTTGSYHCLDLLDLPNYLYQHYNTNVEPMLLGFEAQAVLRDRLGQFDYYCYLEDDLILHDPFFFAKLVWFTEQVGDSALLQPNRYELGASNLVKLYSDLEFPYEGNSAFTRQANQPELSGKIMGQEIKFICPFNPHAGCYFLNAKQMHHWAAQPYFLDRDTSFVGTLESAATLGILRSFKVYKPERSNASFLEIEHVVPRIVHQYEQQFAEGIERFYRKN